MHPPYVSISRSSNGKELLVQSPYSDQFIQRAHELGGRWIEAAKRWVFPVGVEAEVRAACRAIYGEDGEPTPRWTVDVDFPSSSLTGSSLWAFGRELLVRRNRDSPVSTGVHVAIIRGTFARSGGSRNHPSLAPVSDEVTLRIMNVPQHIIDHCDAYRRTGVIVSMTCQTSAEEYAQQRIARAIDLLIDVYHDATCDAGLRQSAAHALNALGVAPDEVNRRAPNRAGAAR